MFDFNQDADGIVTLTLDMPGRSMNVWNGDSMEALASALTRIQQTEGVTGVVITSGKSAFIAGADLDMLEGWAKTGSVDDMYASAGALGDLFRKLETSGVPFVAAINGTALGGGYELCLACHHRIAADNPRAKIGLPEAGLGLLPGAGGTQRLPRLIGVQSAMPLLLEGKQLAPQAALAAGMVDAVVPADQLIDTAKAWLRDSPSPKQPWDVKGFEVPGGGPADPAVSRVFMVASAMFAAKTHLNYPAGRAILSCLFEGLRLPMDQALKVEQRYFVSLMLDPTALNMIRTLFQSMQAASKLTRRPKDVPRLAVSKIGVLGAGLMGAGIAYVAAKKGLDVVVIDVTEAKAQGAVAYATRILDKAISRGRSTEEKKAALLAKIHPTTDYDALEGCQVVIEAVFEDREIKAAVTAEADARLTDAAVFGSNTSTLPITGLAAASSRPERFIGLHFFSPVERMNLVEVITAEQTSTETLAHALDVVAALGKTPIVVKDSRGFYTSRVFGTYINEGLAMLTEGVSPVVIENAGKASGMPMPPLALADEVGIALMHSVALQTAKDLGDAAPTSISAAVAAKMVTELDRTGKRGHGGFYDYDGRSKHVWPGLTEHFPSADEQPEVDDLVERFLMVQAIETARCMDEGLMSNPEDADVGAILGWGFAPYTGGPLSYLDTLGASAAVERARELATALGERFEPPAGLVAQAESGGSYYSA